MLTLMLIRHGETDWNRDGRVMGWKPVPLNATGRAQIGRLAERLKEMPIRALYTSPLTRTAESAGLLAAPLGLAPIPDDRWIEVKVTGWEEKLWSELEGHPIRERYHLEPDDTRLPEGETFREVQQRAVAAMTSLLERHPHETVAVVTHADVIRAAICHALALPLADSRRMRIDNGSLSILELDGTERGALRLLNAPAELARVP